MDYVVERGVGRSDENVVTAENVTRAINEIYKNAENVAITSNIAGLKRDTTNSSLLRKNDTMDLIGKTDIEQVQDELFTKPTEIKLQ
jgi:hypothetical protein